MPVFHVEYLSFVGAGAEYLRVTTIHGLGRIAWANNIIWRIIWTLLFVIAFALFVFSVVHLTKNYSKYRTKKIVSRKTEFEPFAGVTVCNLNALRNNQIKDSVLDEYQRFIKLRTSSEWNISVSDGTPDPYIRERRMFAVILSNNNWRDRVSVGHQLRDLIVHCAYDGRECNLEKDFTQIWNDRYGNCYTFNGGKLNSDYQRKMAKQPGPMNGLKLVLNTESNKHLRTLTESQGVRLLIHRSSEMPFPDQNGLTLPTGMEGTIGITVEELHHLSSPYGGCSADGNNRYLYSYSVTACHKVCRQDAFLFHCGCMDPTMPIFENEKLCDLNDYTGLERECHQNVVYDFLTGAKSCDCPNPCVKFTKLLRDTRYNLDISMSSWPTDKFASGILKDTLYYVEDSEGRRNKTYNVKDLAALKVFFKEIGKTIYSDEAEYPLFDYLNDVAGVSALFIGMSIVSLLEIIELLCTWATLSCCHYEPWVRKKNGKRDGDANKVEKNTPSTRPTTSMDVNPTIPSETELNQTPLPHKEQDWEERTAIASQ